MNDDLIPLEPPYYARSFTWWAFTHGDGHGWLDAWFCYAVLRELEKIFCLTREI